MEINYIAIGVDAIAAFILSSVWYGALGSQLAQLDDAYADSGRLPALKVLAELARNMVLAGVLSGLAAQVGGRPPPVR
jgi:hypothetical protein